MDTPNRIAYLDGLRGLAILLVILYHAFARWPAIVPYGEQYAGVPLFEFGWLGVQLFFLISGFVILMTLETCRGAGDFLYRRWIRLFPAMLFASLLIFATVGLFPERPGENPTLASLLPGLTFIDIKWWQFLFGVPQTPLEGAFWSLYVEFKFYVFAAVIYFWRGRNALLLALVAAHLLSIASVSAAEYFPSRYTFIASKACSAFGITHFGWFAAGALFYVYHKHRDPRWFWLALVVALSCAPFVRKLDWQPLLPAILIALLFAAALRSLLLQKLLNSRPLQFFGLISYPLYLIHENMMVAMIAKLGALTGGSVPGLLLPIVPVLVLSGIAWGIVRFVEPPLRRGIRKVSGQAP